MKIRLGFVSNSSTSSFIITNKTQDILHITNFFDENEKHFKGFCDEWNMFEIDFDRLKIYFQNDEYFVLKPGDNKFEFSDDDMGGFDEKIDVLMHRALEKDINTERFKSKIDECHKY